MAQQQRTEPAYRLNVEKFDRAMLRAGLSTAELLAASGLADRTLTRMRAGVHDVTMPNVRRILSSIPDATFEDLFEPNPAFAAAS